MKRQESLHILIDVDKIFVGKEIIMDRKEIIEKLIEFTAMAYKVDAEGLSEDTNLNELGTSSVMRVAMAASIENEFDVMVPVARFGKFETIGMLADFIEEEA